MTGSVFGQNYAEQYDLLYGDKNYDMECDLIESAIQKFGHSAVKSVLDLGCGTGNHAIPMCGRGYDVQGIDLSHEMLEHARSKATAKLGADASISFQQGDVRQVKIDREFDVVVMMFAVLGYQMSNEDVAATLQSVRTHLKPGGLFFFDVWYGPAVLAQRPSERVKVIPIKSGRVIRAASGTLDSLHHSCEVKYHLWRIQEDRLVSETEEAHSMRYFFPQEIRFMANSAGLEIVDISAFGEFGRQPDDETWNVSITAKAV